MKTGIVKFYHEMKGYGFIKDDATGKDIFVHSSGLQDHIRIGDKVTYEVTEGPKGPMATNVKKVR